MSIGRQVRVSDTAVKFSLRIPKLAPRWAQTLRYPVRVRPSGGFSGHVFINVLPAYVPTW